MRIFKTAWFDRFADKEGIVDDELRGLVNQLEAGQAEADLGGGVFKIRVPVPAEGNQADTVSSYFSGMKIEHFTFMDLPSLIGQISAKRN